MNKNTEISERILQILDYVGVNANDFSKKLEYNRSQTLYDVINGKSAPSYDFFKRLFNSEYSVLINPEWLLTGKGEMLKSEQKSAQKFSSVEEVIDALLAHTLTKNDAISELKNMLK